MSVAKYSNGDQPVAELEEGASLRLIIVDDKPYVCETLAVALPEVCPHLSVVGTFTHPPTLAELQTSCPDLALLDIIGCQGLEVARQLRQLFPRCGILFFTAFPHPSLAEAAARLPGTAFLFKPADLEQLVHILPRLASKQWTTPPASSAGSRSKRSGRAVATGFDHPPARPHVSPEAWRRVRNLTPREIEYAWLRSQGFTNRAIATRLCISVQRACNLGSRLLRKTCCRSMPECIALLHIARVLGRDEVPAVRRRRHD